MSNGELTRFIASLVQANAVSEPGLAQKVIDLAQSALNTGQTWSEADRMSVLVEGLETIIKLCEEQQEK